MQPGGVKRLPARCLRGKRQMDRLEREAPVVSVRHVEVGTEKQLAGSMGATIKTRVDEG